MPKVRQLGVLTPFLLFRRKPPNTFLARWETFFYSNNCFNMLSISGKIIFFIPWLYKFNTLFALLIISFCNLFDNVIATLFFMYWLSIYSSVTGNIFCIKNVLYVFATYPKTIVVNVNREMYKILNLVMYNFVHY